MSLLNVGTVSSTIGVKLPSFTNSTRPSGVEIGHLIYNEETFVVEVWTGEAWVKVGGGGGGLSATGGTITTVGNYTVHTFENSGTFTVNSVSDNATVEVLVVAGGGGGAHWVAGGAGGGGVVYAAAVPVQEGTYSITVGNGGNGMPAGVKNPGPNAYGARGQDSSVGSDIVARGGGGAPGYNASPSNTGEYQYIDGGSGGGGRQSGYGDRGWPYRTYKPVTAVGVCQTFGNQGGNQGGGYGGGGGGAGEVGWGGSQNGKGGDGIFFNFDGTDRYYGAGGGGGAASGTTTSGGLGGGGIGNAGTGNGGDATGYGCGGGSLGVDNNNYQSYRGGNGSKGVVMVRYLKKNVTVQSFTSVGTSTWTVPEGITSVSTLVIAGGGGGAGSNTTGSGPRGGGGAGGFIWRPHIAVTPGSNITVTVGAGGAGGTGSGEVNGVSGENSVFGSLIAIGGGGGGTYINAANAGFSGGSGGGNSYTSGSANNAGTQFQGYRGGTGMKYGIDGASGGGGAGSAGFDTRQISDKPDGSGGGDRGINSGGDGGHGRLCPISGTALYYAGGGGAGGYPSGTNNIGLGGSGVGGNGAHGASTATQGADGTGSGGGAGGSSSKGARGGNGVVIIAF
jgi:hypothetical protein